MKLTVQIQLLPNPEQATTLRQTMERFNTAADWIAGELFARKLANKILAQKLLYADVRQRFELSSQTAILCIHRVVEAYKRDRNKRPRFRKHAAITYDQRTYSFKGIDRVSLLTIAGRVLIPFVLGAYQRERFTFRKGQADLVLRKDGKWFLLVTVDLPDGTPTPATDFLGVDLGVINIVTDSDGKAHSGETVERVRQRHQRNRQRLQKKRSKGAKKRLKLLAGREARFRRQVNHVISKELVAKAKRTGRGIVLENLQGIRDRVRLRKRQRAKHSGWSFFQLRSCVEYKAKLAGVPVVLVDPRNTSRTCSQCGYCDKANRQSQAVFACLHCDFSTNADYNAACNLRRLGAIGNPPSELASA